MGFTMVPLVQPQPIIYVLEPFGGSARLHNPMLPHVFHDDAAVTRGDGVFEAILLLGGEPTNLDRHAARFASSAARLGLPAPYLGQWREVTAAAAQAWHAQHGEKHPAARCTWTYTRGRESTGVPSAWVTVGAEPREHARARAEGARALTGPRGYQVDTGDKAAPWLTTGAKTLNYAANMAALRHAKQNGFDDVIFVDTETGRVLEATTSTVIVVKKGRRLRTPRPGQDILSGTSQQALFEYAGQRGYKCKVKDLYVDDLLSAESVWLVSSVRRGVRVTAVNEVELPAPKNAAEIASLIDAALAD